MIEITVHGTFTDSVEGGTTESEREPIWDSVQDAHRELMARRDKDIGFYNLAYDEGPLKAITAEVNRLRALAEHLLVLGIGGSSLGGQALVSALSPGGLSGVPVYFLDNVDPDTVNYYLKSLEPEKTVAVVITKSGATIETLAQFLIVRRWFKDRLGEGETRSRMSFVTDPEKGFLRQLSRKEGIRALEIPENVGGRFSVLTPVGLLPAAFAGIDVGEVLAGARDMADQLTQDDSGQSPASLLAASIFALYGKGRNQLVMMPYSDALRLSSSWFVQLWAESLGKRFNRHGEEVRTGQTPIAALGATDQHAQVQLFVEGPKDKMVCLISVDEPNGKLNIPNELEGIDEVSFLHGQDLGELLDAERRGTRVALLEAGVPVVDLRIKKLDAATMGAFFILLEATCACMGLLMGINPFDQPGVEAGKRMALGLMGRAGYEEDAQRVYLKEQRGQK